MKTNSLIVYRACKMTGLYKDELVIRSEQTNRMLALRGFTVLDPVVIEKVERVHEVLEQTDPSQLNRYWIRDKECLKECHIILDDGSCNKSDGVGIELGLARFTYWKPVIRIFPNAGICISKIEYDYVFDNAVDAVDYMAREFGTKRQLLIWRVKMLIRCLPKFVWLQIKFLGDLL
jgi:hypothetical protein